MTRIVSLLTQIQGSHRFRWVESRTRDALRFVRPVMTRIRRWPRVALVVAVVLSFVLSLVPDLFYMIPWPFRKMAGWVVFAAVLAVGLGRILLVRAKDEVPPRDEGRSSRWLAWVLPLFCAALAVPLLRHPENLGYGDWDLFLEKYEAVRRTIVNWGEFPWWDPWCRGGFPLAANPQCGVVGVATPLVLAFGTSVGMRLATIVCYLLAAEGARRLALLWLAEPCAAVAAGLIYGLNGGVLVASVAAYHLSMCYCALPWLLYYTFRLERRRADALWLGAWLAFNVLNGIQYFSVYALLIVAVVWLRAARVRSGRVRARFLTHTVLALGVFLALAGWRLVTTGLVYRDFPRPYATGWDESIWSISLHLLHRPSAATLIQVQVPYFWETTVYVGPVVVGLGLASLAWGWRWWHTLTLVCGVLAAGSIAWYHLSYWLAHWPVFSSMHVVTRWRFMAVLGLALAAASVLARWRLGPRPALRTLAVGLVVLIASDYVAYGYQILDVAFRVPPTEDHFPGPPVSDVVQVGDALGFPAVLRGYGVIHGFEPLMGYDRRAVTARLWRGHPDYIGEHWTGSQRVEPLSWSPNRIRFQVGPGQEVVINQNPGSWWLVNGRRIDADARCAEKEWPFLARADSRGRLDLQVQPPGLRLALWLHVIGVALMGLALLGTRAIPEPGNLARN